MRILTIADLHGHTPDLSSRDFDAVLIGGDITPHPAKDYAFQAKWLDEDFRAWLIRLDVPVLATFGNHDVVGQKRPDVVPADLPWKLLNDAGGLLRLPSGRHLKVYGSPWQPEFGTGWAYNLSEPELAEKWRAIPEGVDLLLLHGPPHGFGDLSPYGNVRTGSPSLTRRIEELKPKLVIAGHIHSQAGVYKIGPTTFVNAAYVDENYKPAQQPIVVELDDATGSVVSVENPRAKRAASRRY